MYAWELGGGKAVKEALIQLQPFLILKRQECDVLLDLISTMRKGPWDTSPLLPEEIAHRKALAAQLKELKQGND